MRRLAFGLGLLGLSACVQQGPQDTIYPVFFTDFSSNLDPAGIAIVTNAAAAAQAHPSYTVEVTGYADAAQIGSAQGASDLSRARADAVANLLQRDGVAAARIKRDAIGSPPNSQPGVERRRVTIFLNAP